MEVDAEADQSVMAEGGQRRRKFRIMGDDGGWMDAQSSDGKEVTY